jgi:hypothetical protein
VNVEREEPGEIVLLKFVSSSNTEKRNMSLCLITHHAMAALDGGNWSASRPDRFTIVEPAPVTHCIDAGCSSCEELTLYFS